MKSILRDLKKNPRIELISSILNFPLVIVWFVLLSVVPNVEEIINNEAKNIFGMEGEFVSLLTLISAVILIFISLLTISSLFKREKTPVYLHLIPGFLFIFYEIILVFAIRSNDYLTINYIYQNIGREISLIVYLGLAFILLTCILVLLRGFPLLWNAKNSTNPKFKSKHLAMISLFSALSAFSLIFLFLIGHDAMVFWQVVLTEIHYDSIVLITLVAAGVSFLIINIKAQRIGEKNQISTKKLDKYNLVLIFIQILLISILGFRNGILITLLSPFALFLYLQALYLVVHQKGKKHNNTSSLTSVEHERKIRFIKKFGMISAISWIILFQPLISLPPEPIIPTVELNVVRNTFSSLTTTQKTLFEDYLNEKVPPNATPGEFLPSASERGSTRIASALLFRNEPGDIEHASYILNHVMDGENNVVFIGCDLILILEHHQEKLDEALVERIINRLLLIAEEAYLDNVRPSYTNIALMSAFVMEWVGIQMNRTEIYDAGIQKAWDIYLLFQRHNTFSEFNSPTYGGVDMVAITMWRELGPTDTMRKMGAIMEQTFWEELSEFYHPSFRNLVGPYFRKYGMDMRAYTAIIGIYIALVVDDLSIAPLPTTYNNENENIFTAVQVGHSIPKPEILQKFKTFTLPRNIERRVPSDISGIGKEYKVTATLNPEWMMGGVSGRSYGGGQFATGTLAWNSTDQSLAWILISGIDRLDVMVKNNTMEISQTRLSNSIVFYINCINMTSNVFSTTNWDLSGMSLKVDLDPTKITTEILEKEQFRHDFEIRENLENNITKVICSTNQLQIHILG